MGESIAVNCMITKGDLPLQIKWTLNNRTLENEDGISITRMSARLSSLSIDSISSDHRGVFGCIAFNEAGKTDSSSELRANGNRNQWLL